MQVILYVIAGDIMCQCRCCCMSIQVILYVFAGSSTDNQAGTPPYVSHDSAAVTAFPLGVGAAAFSGIPYLVSAHSLESSLPR